MVNLSVDDIKNLYEPFEGPYRVFVEQDDTVTVEDSNQAVICIFNRYTQLPLQEDLMEFEKRFWIDRAKQIVDALNRDWHSSKGLHNA